MFIIREPFHAVMRVCHQVNVLCHLRRLHIFQMGWNLNKFCTSGKRVLFNCSYESSQYLTCSRQESEPSQFGGAGKNHHGGVKLIRFFTLLNRFNLNFSSLNAVLVCSPPPNTSSLLHKTVSSLLHKTMFVMVAWVAALNETMNCIILPWRNRTHF